jgi:hypothetical protein
MPERFNKHNLYEGNFFVYQSGSIINGYFEELKISVIKHVIKHDIHNQNNTDLWWFEFLNWPRVHYIPETRIVYNKDLLDIYETKYSQGDHAFGWYQMEEAQKLRLAEYARNNREVLKWVRQPGKRY